MKVLSWKVCGKTSKASSRNLINLIKFGLERIYFERCHAKALSSLMIKSFDLRFFLSIINLLRSLYVVDVLNDSKAFGEAKCIKDDGKTWESDVESFKKLMTCRGHYLYLTNDTYR